MIIAFATVAVLITVYLFIRDASSQQIINSQFTSFYSPFQAETIVQHEYVSKPETVWKALTHFEDYCLWFPGINRALPVVDNVRYVHRFSFDKFSLESDSLIKIRPKSFSPWFKARIVGVESNKRLDMEMRFNPVNKETISFKINLTPRGTSEVICRRSSNGLFSFMTTWQFADKGSSILHNLSYFLPENREENEGLRDRESDENATPKFSKKAIIAKAVQSGFDGNMDLINAIQDKPTRGIAKAALVKAKRSGKIPADLIAELKANPISPTAEPPVQKASETEEELITRLVASGLDGNMDIINALENRVLRGKIKAAIVREKRKGL